MKLNNITNCHVCGSKSLTFIANVPIEDVVTDETYSRDVLMCSECDTMHYIRNNEISYEFSVRFSNTEYSKTKIKIDD